MFNILEMLQTPTLNDLSDYVRNPLWDKFCDYIIDEYKVKPIFEYSKCSWARGWNVKFKKSGKTLCTLYPKEGFFTMLVVIGQKEKEQFLDLLPILATDLQTLYHNTKEGMGQRWLMIDLEDEDDRVEDVKKIIAIRRGGRREIYKIGI